MSTFHTRKGSFLHMFFFKITQILNEYTNFNDTNIVGKIMKKIFEKNSGNEFTSQPPFCGGNVNFEVVFLIPSGVCVIEIRNFYTFFADTFQ